MVLAGFIGLVACSTLALPRVLISGIPAFFIVAGAVFYERAHNVAEIGVPKLLGDASYSLYLSHGAVLSAFGQLWRKLGFPHTSEPMYVFLFMLTGVLIATIVGIGVYRFVERPLLQKLSARSKQINFKSYYRASGG